MTEPAPALSHDEAARLLPWLVNGTLQGRERAGVERHVRDCLACRSELREQHALRTLVQRHPDVHVSAEQGFAALAGRLEQDRMPRKRGVAAGAAGACWRACRGLAVELASGAARRRWAMVGLGAIALAAVVAAWVLRPEGPEAPAYSTLTGAEDARAVDVDLVFAPGTSEADRRAVVDSVGGTIVAGPSAVGRYTVRVADTDADLDALLRALLADPRVRFAGRAYIAPEEP